MCTFKNTGFAVFQMEKIEGRNRITASFAEDEQKNLGPRDQEYYVYYRSDHFV